MHILFATFIIILFSSLIGSMTTDLTTWYAEGDSGSISNGDNKDTDNTEGEDAGNNNINHTLTIHDDGVNGDGVCEDGEELVEGECVPTECPDGEELVEGECVLDAELSGINEADCDNKVVIDPTVVDYENINIEKGENLCIIFEHEKELECDPTANGDIDRIYDGTATMLIYTPNEDTLRDSFVCDA